MKIVFPMVMFDFSYEFITYMLIYRMKGENINNKSSFELFKQWSIIWYILIFRKMHLRRVQKCHFDTGIIIRQCINPCKKFIITLETTYEYMLQLYKEWF